MYHWITERWVRSIFAAISKGNVEPMLDTLASRFVYRFEGDTALGGERHTRGAMQLWWQRIFRLFPGLTFEVRDIIVKGWPWRTRIATYLRFHAVLPDGRPYHNDVMQIMAMRWGRITNIHTIEDTLRCARTLDMLAARGQLEAVAAPIVDAA
jgi:ketosteroid isomerase-like protein